MFILLVGMLSLVGSKETLKFVMEISRHGARAPKKIFKGLLKDEKSNFDKKSALTPKGEAQHFILGKQIYQ
jgi:hypothetical protein